jgi:hypothetical protein
MSFLLNARTMNDKIAKEKSILKKRISPAEYCCKALRGIEKKPHITKAVMPAK